MRHRKSPAPLRRRTLVFALLAASLVPTAASIAAEEKDAGLSAGWTIERNHLGLQRLTTPGIDRDWIELQDMKKLDAGQPLTRFAIAHTHKIAPTHFGSWDQPAPGIMRWRLVLSSPDAVSINLGFSRFTLPEGAELTLLDGSGKAQFRSFTAADNDDHGQLWTPIVRGDEVTLVLTVPAKAVDAVQLEIGKVNHGYRGLGEIPWFAKSGACNVDVICPEGDDWREQIRSVAALTRFGVDQCSGALVNNAEGDLRGYFLTAAHCDFNNNTDAAGMVAYWDFENSTCRTPGGGPSGGAGDGTLTEFNTGAIFRASRAASDFTLVEFDDPIDPDTTPYWAGIDARDQATTSAVAIHHPSVDEKRISFEDDPTTITSYLGEPVPGDGTHIRVTDWDLGTTEGGSSGSPLFSPDKHIVGQFHGGFASCSSQTSDWYGRVAVSWETGLTDATQLKAWLDPNDTGVLIIDGRNEIEAGFNIDLDPVALEVCAIDPGTEADISVAVTQEDVGFLDPVTLSVTDLPANATSGFATNPVVPGNGTTLTLGALEQVTAGSYVIGVEGTDGVDTVAKATR
jgi:lysyl endopeptidase